MSAQQAALPKRRGGRRPKDPDPRPQMTARVPTAHRDIYIREAKALGIDVTDYLALMLARGKGLKEPEYVLDRIERARQAREAERMKAAEIQAPLLEAS